MKKKGGLVMAEQKNPISEFAIASLVMGIVSFIHILNIEKAAVAIVFGVLALKRIKVSAQFKGKKLAIAGIVLGTVSVIATITVTVIFWPQMQQMMQKMAGQQ
ncbi:MAG: hypothetical protein A3K83_03255 [Omnitrophica WOR_2 bacterium RBG_13_44_8b]|nr:MAG: hypothetical protein A3K83_03255 [Omnitrophica WOR_2 bacterium RBG_13_44_8b]